MMNYKKILILLAVVLGMTASAEAKKMPVPKMYVFGMAASFTDSVVVFTDVQELDSAWIDAKSKFLLERDQYSFQLRDYMAEKMQMPHRTCIVFFNQDREKLEKKYVKMRRLYTQSGKGQKQFDLRFLEQSDFKFKDLPSVYFTENEEEVVMVKTKKEKKEKGKKGDN